MWPAAIQLLNWQSQYTDQWQTLTAFDAWVASAAGTATIVPIARTVPIAVGVPTVPIARTAAAASGVPTVRIAMDASIARTAPA